MARTPKPQLALNWLPAFVLGVLISIIGYLLADRLDDMKTAIREIGSEVTEQAKDVIRLESRVDALERKR